MCGYKTIVGMVNGMLEELNITVPVALHLDHGSYEGCYKAISGERKQFCDLYSKEIVVFCPQ